MASALSCVIKRQSARPIGQLPRLSDLALLNSDSFRSQVLGGNYAYLAPHTTVRITGAESSAQLFGEGGDFLLDSRYLEQSLNYVLPRERYWMTSEWRNSCDEYLMSIVRGKIRLIILIPGD